MKDLALNWIDRIFGKKETFSPEISFYDLQGWLESKSKKLSEEVGRRAASLYPDIEEALFEIKKNTNLLEEAEPEGRFHLKMVKIASSNRDNMVKQVRMLAENIAVPKENDIRAIIFFHENTMQTLTVCLENMMKSYQYAKMVFPEDSKQVIAGVNSLGRLLNQLIEPVNENKKALDAFEIAANAIQTIKNMHSEIEIEKKAIKELSENVILLKKEIEENQKYLAELKDSEQWKQYRNGKIELADLENKARQAESEITGLVLPLNKALIRLKQLSESGRYTLAPDIREGLYLCLSDPKSVNPGFFAEFEKIVKSDTLNIASEKKDKILEQIKLAESSFDPCKKRYRNLVLDIEMKKGEIAKLNLEREEQNIGSRIAALLDRLDASEKGLEISKKHLASLEQSVELKKQELQQIVSTIDGRMRVSF